VPSTADTEFAVHERAALLDEVIRIDATLDVWTKFPNWSTNLTVGWEGNAIPPVEDAGWFTNSTAVRTGAATTTTLDPADVTAYEVAGPSPVGVTTVALADGIKVDIWYPAVVRAGAVAETIHTALATPPEERERRLVRMRRRLETSTVFDWMESIFAEVERLRRKK